MILGPRAHSKNKVVCVNPHKTTSVARPVGSSRRVEWPSVVMSEAAQRPTVSREVRKKFATYFYGGKEAALAASRYIEGHVLTLRKKNLHTSRDQAYSQLIVSRAVPHSYAALEWGVVHVTVARES